MRQHQTNLGTEPGSWLGREQRGGGLSGNRKPQEEIARLLPKIASLLSLPVPMPGALAWRHVEGRIRHDIRRPVLTDAEVRQRLADIALLCDSDPWWRRPAVVGWLLLIAALLAAWLLVIMDMASLGVAASPSQAVSIVRAFGPTELYPNLDKLAPAFGPAEGIVRILGEVRPNHGPIPKFEMM